MILKIMTIFIREIKEVLIISKRKIHIPQIGERFGRLVVLRKGEDKIDLKTGKHKSRYWCQCDCGSPEKPILGTSLTSKKVRSCGCLHKEMSSEAFKTKCNHGKKYNTYDLSGEYGVGYTIKGEKFYFDLEDYEKIKDICWGLSSNGYIVGHIIGTNKEIKLHQLIMPDTPFLVVDHKNSANKYDNRKSNLRLAMQNQNVRNKRLYNDGIISGIKFENNNYIVSISKNYSNIYLGKYENLEDAIKAKLQAEIELYGEYSSRDIPKYLLKVKKEVLKLFKPVHFMTSCCENEFNAWLNNELYYDEEFDKMTDIPISDNSLKVIDYMKKYDTMELFFHSKYNITIWGYFGLQLKDIKNSCLVKAGLFNVSTIN